MQESINRCLSQFNDPKRRNDPDLNPDKITHATNQTIDALNAAPRDNWIQTIIRTLECKCPNLEAFPAAAAATFLSFGKLNMNNQKHVAYLQMVQHIFVKHTGGLRFQKPTDNQVSWLAELLGLNGTNLIHLTASISDNHNRLDADGDVNGGRNGIYYLKWRNHFVYHGENQRPIPAWSPQVCLTHLTMKYSDGFFETTEGAAQQIGSVDELNAIMRDVLPGIISDQNDSSYDSQLGMPLELVSRQAKEAKVRKGLLADFYGGGENGQKIAMFMQNNLKFSFKRDRTDNENDLSFSKKGWQNLHKAVKTFREQIGSEGLARLVANASQLRASGNLEDLAKLPGPVRAVEGHSRGGESASSPWR